MSIYLFHSHLICLGISSFKVIKFSHKSLYFYFAKRFSIQYNYCNTKWHVFRRLCVVFAIRFLYDNFLFINLIICVDFKCYVVLTVLGHFIVVLNLALNWTQYGSTWNNHARRRNYVALEQKRKKWRRMNCSLKVDAQCTFSRVNVYLHGRRCVICLCSQNVIL